MARCQTLLLTLLTLVAGCGCPEVSAPATSVPSAAPSLGLDGAWFVVYADDPLPYLDVAFSDGSAVPTRVWASLRQHAPMAAERRFELTWNVQDAEWQADCSGLAKPGVGIWYLPEVQAELADGQIISWTAKDPWTSYGGTDVPPGFFFVPGPEGPRTRIVTAAVPGAAPADTAIFVFGDDDLSRWIGAADDPITTSPFAILEMPLEPGRYLVRVDGSEEAGEYAIHRGAGGDPGPPEVEPDGPDSATSLQPGRTYVRRVGGDDLSDWFVLEVGP